MTFYIGKFCQSYVSSEGSALPPLTDKRNILHGSIRVPPSAQSHEGTAKVPVIWSHLLRDMERTAMSPGFKETQLKASLYDKELGLWAAERDSLESRNKHTEMKRLGRRKTHQEMLRRNLEPRGKQTHLVTKSSCQREESNKSICWQNGSCPTPSCGF